PASQRGLALAKRRKPGEGRRAALLVPKKRDGSEHGEVLENAEDLPVDDVFGKNELGIQPPFYFADGPASVDEVQDRDVGERQDALGIGGVGEPAAALREIQPPDRPENSTPGTRQERHASARRGRPPRCRAVRNLRDGDLSPRGLDLFAVELGALQKA